MRNSSTFSVLCVYHAAMTNRTVHLLKWIGALSSGLMLASAFPPLEYTEAAWVGLAPLLLAVFYSNPSESFKLGWFSGAVFWLCNIGWLLNLGFTGGPMLLVAAGWLLLSIYAGLYIGLFCWVTAWWFSKFPQEKWHNSVLLTLAIPLLWIGLEYARSTLFTGFPWNQLGVSQYRNLVIIQMASWGGVYAVSGIVMLVNAGIATTAARHIALHRIRRRVRIHVELFIVLTVLAIALVGGRRALLRLAMRSGGRPVTIAVIQPDVEQLKKWPDEFRRHIAGKLWRQTDLASVMKPDLIVWPETSAPGAVRNDPELAWFVSGMAREKAPILVGSMDVRGADQEPVNLVDLEEGLELEYHNCSFLFDRNGMISGDYSKRHLVPFGEYIPLSRWIKPLERVAPLGWNCSAGNTSTVFQLRIDEGAVASVNIVPFSVLLCFEDTVAWLARKSVRNGAKLIINQTNDAWFDPSSASLQHACHSVFRAVENRVAVVRSANTGMSCLISDTGVLGGSTGDRVLKTNAESFLMVAPVIHDDAGKTFYARWGDLFLAVPCFVLAVAHVLYLAGRHAVNRWRGRKLKLATGELSADTA